MRAVVKKKKPRLLQRHKQQRMEFARRYQNWTVDDWKRVIWSDETKINRFGADGRQWVWKRPSNVLTDQHIQPTVKFGGGSMMVLGCMTANGVNFATRIDGRMDSSLYISILDDELRQTVEYYHLDWDYIVFQHDIDSKHTSTLMRNWLDENEIETLQWPAQSPDLNPIENLWDHIKWKLSAYEN